MEHDPNRTDPFGVKKGTALWHNANGAKKQEGDMGCASGKNALRLLAYVALAVALASTLTGCAHRAPSSAAQLRGVVTSFDRSNNGVLSLRVVWDASLGADLGLDAAQVTVTTKTAVFESATGNLADAVATTSDALKVRDIVDVWFTGPVLESYPVQATASDVVITGSWPKDRALPVPPGLRP